MAINRFGGGSNPSSTGCGGLYDPYSPEYLNVVRSRSTHFVPFTRKCVKCGSFKSVIYGSLGKNRRFTCRDCNAAIT